MRSLSAMYLTNFKFSNEFTNALRSYASDKDKNGAFLSTAMHFELTNFENIELQQLEADNMSPSDVKHIEWQLPEYAVKDLLFSADHSTDVELPLYHPEFKDFLKPCYVKSIYIIFKNEKEVNNLLRLSITHLGNVNVADA